MEKRADIIQKWINVRKAQGEVTGRIFYITVPKRTNLSTDEIIKRVEDILDRNNISYSHRDTVCGAWNMGRDWIETDEMDCIVEFCGVYPVNWDINDVAELEWMENNGVITILVN